MDLRDEEHIWSDLKEFDIPEKVNTSSGQYLNIIQDKLVSMLNYLTWVNQYIPDVQYDMDVLDNKIQREYRRQHKIIQYYLANNKDIPNSHRRSRDLMIAYIEGTLALDKLTKGDGKIDEMEDDFAIKTKQYKELELKREVLIQGIESCQVIADSLLWEIKNGSKRA